MPPKKHATLGGSGAYRWMACPGSVRLSEDVPEQPTSKYAIEGSAAHELAERCLAEDVDPARVVGAYITVDGDEDEYEAVEVTEEMAGAVQVYLDHVNERLARGHDLFFVEMRVSLEKLDPPAPMFGTADAVITDGDTLELIDYKHGQGVVVEAEQNPQLMYYALGAVLELGVKPEEIRVTIVQPRAEHEDGPIRSWSFGWDTLVSFKEELMYAAHQTTEPDAPVGPVGEHCRFCPAKAICPAQKDNALTVVQDEFANLPAEGPPPPEALTDDALLEVLDAAPMVEDWIKEIRAYAKRRLMEGDEFPNHKLVRKRARRYWKDEDEARAFMEEHGISPYREKLRSPYQAEQAAKSLDVEVPEELWEKKSSGFNLATEDNPREAVTPALLAAEEFDADDE